MIRDVLDEWRPLAYDAGLTPSEFRQCTFGELREVVLAETRRRARRADDQAWMVAHLMLASGNMRRGMSVTSLVRELLGREPGTVPGQTEAGRRPEHPGEDIVGAQRGTLTPEASANLIAAWVTGLGGIDQRPKRTDGA